MKELVSKTPPEEKLRVFSCGGDGTFNEVLNGGAGSENLSFGVIPVGTGNDFIRNFPGSGAFLSVRRQLSGKEVLCDAIKFSGVINGEYRERYCANMFNIGFDANVCDMTARLKNYPLISGSFAYLLAVFIMLISKKGANLKIGSAGETVFSGRLLLSSVANGAFCGGGIKSNPGANVSNGKMNVNIVKNISRLRFLTLFPKYKKGTHMSLKNVDRFIINSDFEKLSVTPLDGYMKLCVDGEIYKAEKTEFEIMPGFFKMTVPER